MNVKLKSALVSAAVLSLMVAHAVPSLAQEQSPPNTRQEQSATANSAQSQVDQDVTKKAKEQRDKVIADAVTALNETKKALALLEDKKTDETLAALERATGKLELILARDPKLALAPVDTRVVIRDLYSEPDTVKDMIKKARELLDGGEVQKARPLLAGLVSDVVFETANLPLATYPEAIKSAVRLIDEGKMDEAKVVLQSALNTLVVVADVVVPLPAVRAQHLLKKAEKLTENDKRDDKMNEELGKLLAEVRKQIQLAEILGYGKNGHFEPIYEQVKQIEEKTSGGKSGKGWLDKIKEQISNLF
ncbi:MAG: YfdX family protein [Magnetococcales bacterium]|nr:YfdX family protein [Magnetococcales bacterium]